MGVGFFFFFFLFSVFLFCYLGFWRFCYCIVLFFFNKDLKLSGQRRGEDLEGLRGGEEYNKMYLNLKLF